MADTLNRGPNVSAGSLMDGRVEIMDGPSVAYQGEIVPDPRYSPINKDSLNPGAVPGFMMSPTFVVIDAIPSIANATAIAASQAIVSTVGVALTLVTSTIATAAGVPVFTPGVPIVPFGSSVATTVFALDFGFTNGSTTANSSTVQVTDNTILQTGQWLVIGGAASVTNKCLITQIASVSGTNLTTIFINPVAGSTIAFAPIGQGNYYGNLQPSSPGASIGPQQASAFAAEPYIVAGFSKVVDAREVVARNLQFLSAGGASGTGQFLVTGYDIYGVPMTEIITASGTTAAQGSGKKAWKYISSITTQVAATTGTPQNVSVGPGNVVGFPLRNNKWEYLDIFWGGAFTVTNAGWTAAVTGTSTNTTGDVRGTQALQSAVVGSTGVSQSAVVANGANRLTITQSMEVPSMLIANPLNANSMFGIPQA